MARELELGLARCQPSSPPPVPPQAQALPEPVQQLEQPWEPVQQPELLQPVPVPPQALPERVPRLEQPWEPVPQPELLVVWVLLEPPPELELVQREPELPAALEPLIRPCPRWSSNLIGPPGSTGLSRPRGLVRPAPQQQPKPPAVRRAPTQSPLAPVQALLRSRMSE